MSKEKKPYLVLARKYRPHTFKEVVGQSSLITTLENAIKINKIPHAFILTGIRGVGKTTTARIIAKALNCLGESGNNDKPISPCGKCFNCKAIANFTHEDVIEIDAASKTGVDDIRSIIESSRYAPIRGRSKVFIIDEVHMLSKNAFNALLKTLEEPPAHVTFILATTEIRKVPATILSRCQRFELARLNTEEITQHIKNSLAKEDLKIEGEALNLIAKFSEGSVRDALSITDQAIAMSGNRELIKTADVEKMLGVNDRQSSIELLQLILNNDMERMLIKFSDIYAKSTDVENLLNDLLELIHSCSMAKVMGEQYLKKEGWSKSQIATILKIAEGISVPAAAKLWKILLSGKIDLLQSHNQKQAFEMLLIRVAYSAKLPDLDKLIKEYEKKSADNNIIADIKTNPQLKQENILKSQEQVAVNESQNMIEAIKENFKDARMVS